MDWIKTFNELVQKIEDNAIGASYEEILKEVPDVSPYFKKMFMELTHVSLRDYLIQRKMYHCALALAGGENAADLSERAGYMSYEGFRMAFNRYQEANPNDIRKNPGLIKHSPPLRNWSGTSRESAGDYSGSESSFPDPGSTGRFLQFRRHALL